MVIEELTKLGYIIDIENVESTISMLIEAAVKELNIDQQEHVMVAKING